MTKFIIEILKEINEKPELIKQYRTNVAIQTLFNHAFDPSKKFVLPEGIPPYKQDAAPLGMNPSNLYVEMKRLYVFCRNDLTALKRESLFVQLLENIHPSEAEVILAVKDQTLSSLFPNITHKLVYDVGMVIAVPQEKEKKARKKSVQKPDGVVQ